MSQSNIIKAMESLSFADPRRVPALPLRPSWPAEEATNRRTNALYSAKFLMDTWNLWADCVEKVFQQMGDQTEALEVSDDQYIGLVRMFASHSARPTPRQLEKITEHEEDSMKSMPDRYLAQLHHLWTVYADTLEKTYISMAAELGRCNLLAAPFETMSTRGQLHGILRSMMGPGRMFQGLVDRRAPEAMTVAETRLQGPSISHIDQMVSGIEDLNLCGAPAMQGGVVDGLVMLLKKISIEAGKS